MQRLTFAILLGGSFLLLVVGFLARQIATARADLQDAPTVEFQDLIDLNAVTNGTIIKVPVELTCRASHEVTLSGFSGNCPCQQIYEIVDSGKRQLTEAQLSPGET